MRILVNGRCGGSRESGTCSRATIRLDRQYRFAPAARNQTGRLSFSFGVPIRSAGSNGHSGFGHKSVGCRHSCGFMCNGRVTEDNLCIDVRIGRDGRDDATRPAADGEPSGAASTPVDSSFGLHITGSRFVARHQRPSASTRQRHRQHYQTSSQRRSVTDRLSVAPRIDRTQANSINTDHDPGRRRNEAGPLRKLVPVTAQDVQSVW